MVRLSLNLRLDAIGLSVGDIVSRCRDRIVSPYLIHHTVNHNNAPAGKKVQKLTIEKVFLRARRLSDLKWGNPPTFHELQSLSGRLYDAQGKDAQSLVGHKDSKTTALYTDSRGTEWIEVSCVSGKFWESFGKSECP